MFIDYMQKLISWGAANFRAIGIFFGVLLAFYIFKSIVLRRLKSLSEQTKNQVDDFLVDVMNTIRLPFGILLALISALIVIDIPPVYKTIVGVFIIIVVTYQVVKVVGVIFNYGQKKIGKRNGTSLVQGFKTILYVLIWIAGALSVISLLGYNINSILAGFGIGGIAVALAAQNILEDIFSSFSIYFDRPFSVGDYIQVDQTMGTVEKIGLKSTRIRSLRGEQVVISNRELTNQIIQNFGLLKKRRVVEELGITYETSNSKLVQLSNDIASLVELSGKTEFERLYFKNFAESSLLFELSYYVNSHDFEEFTKVKHQINLDIKDYFEKQKLEFAYPTRTIYTKT